MTSTLTAKPRLKLPPGPRRFPVLGLGPADWLAFLRDRPGYLLSLAARFGDMVYLEAGARPIYLLNHPDYVEAVLVKQHRHFVKGPALRATRQLLGNGLLTSEGSDHLRQRRLIQPIFHRQRIEAYAQAMVEAAARTAASWRPGANLNVADEMMGLTLSIVGQTLFGTNVEAETREVSRVMQVLMEAFTRFNSPLARLYELFRLAPVQQAEQARARLDGLVYRMIDEHRARGDRGDLLSRLLAAQDEAGGQPMPDAQVRDEAMTLFLAGHETTANALNWTWHALAQNPAAEAGLHAEVDAVLAGRLPTAEDLPQLPYTHMVLAEAMRLYPPVWVIGRSVLDDIELGGYRLPAGATVIMSQWVLQRDPRFFDEPLAFRPERWRPEAQIERPKYAYFPFGAGPRVCIGEHFAWMEGSLVLATLAQRWRLRPAPGAAQVAYQASITLRPRPGPFMTAEPRLIHDHGDEHVVDP